MTEHKSKGRGPAADGLTVTPEAFGRDETTERAEDTRGITVTPDGADTPVKPEHATKAPAKAPAKKAAKKAAKPRKRAAARKTTPAPLKSVSEPHKGKA